MEDKTINVVAFGPMGPSVCSQTECGGQVRWVPLSMLQGHRRRLQQLWIITDYEDGKPVRRRREWRDVPEVSEDDAG